MKLNTVGGPHEINRFFGKYQFYNLVGKNVGGFEFGFSRFPRRDKDREWRLWLIIIGITKWKRRLK